MFGINNIAKMPPEFITDNDIWDSFVGDIWAKVIGDIDFKSVVEIAPGSSIKIACCLSKLNFTGDIYVIDSDSSVLDVLRPKYKDLLPRANIKFINKLLKEAINEIEQPIDLVLGNHILDDMIIGESYQNMDSNIFAWATEYTNIPSQEIQEFWREIKKDKPLIESSKMSVLNDLNGFIKKVNPDRVVLSQYPSSALYDNDMSDLNSNAYDILEKLKAMYQVNQSEIQNSLNEIENFGNKHIGENLLNARYWLSCKL